MGLAEIIGRSKGPVLVIGIGGGGDVVSGIHIKLRLETAGMRAFLGAVLWERWVNDPTPGPIDIAELEGHEPLGRFAAMLKPSTKACRGGRCFKPQAVRVSQALGEHVVGFTVAHGASGFAEGLVEAAGKLGSTTIVAVDAGGDVLARGDEEELWSPLADQVALAGLVEAAERAGLRTFLAVHGLGCDGEIPRDKLLGRMAEIASMGGLLGFDGLTHGDLEVLDRVLRLTVTEASRLPREAFSGAYGWRSMRKGSRKVWLDPFSAVTVLLDPHVVYEASPMAKALSGTTSIWKAKEKLNLMGIYTELDLELDIARHGDSDLEGLRRRGKARLRRARAS